jgi:hypothetical protein
MHLFFIPCFFFHPPMNKIMNLLSEIPEDAFMYLIPFLTRRTAAALASTCKRFLHLLRVVPHVWHRQLVLVDASGPYTHLGSKPQLAFTAHAPHITHITFGSLTPPPHHTRVNAYHFTALLACVNLQELHLCVPHTHMAATGNHLLTVLQTLRHLKLLTTPFQFVTLDEESNRELLPYSAPPASDPVAHLTTLHLHGNAPVLQQWRPSCLQHVCRDTLTTLRLYQVNSMNVEHLLRTFNQLRHLHMLECTPNKNAFATALPLWHNRIMTLQTLIIHQSKRVVHSLRPLLAFFLSWTTPLPITVLGGDWDDTAFMYFLATHCCVQCSRTRDATNANVMRLSLCAQCTAALPLPLEHLRVLEVNYCCSALPGCTNPTRATLTPR